MRGQMTRQKTDKYDKSHLLEYENDEESQLLYSDLSSRSNELIDDKFNGGQTSSTTEARKLLSSKMQINSSKMFEDDCDNDSIQNKGSASTTHNMRFDYERVTSLEKNFFQTNVSHAANFSTPKSSEVKGPKLYGVNPKIVQPKFSQNDGKIFKESSSLSDPACTYPTDKSDAGQCNETGNSSRDILNYTRSLRCSSFNIKKPEHLDYKDCGNVSAQSTMGTMSIFKTLHNRFHKLNFHSETFTADRILRKFRQDEVKYQPAFITGLQRYLPWYRSSIEQGIGSWSSATPSEIPYENWSIEFLARWENTTDRYLMLIRFTLYFAVILGLFIINIILKADVSPQGSITSDEVTIWDFLHENAISFNDLVRRNNTVLSLLLLVASFCMDLIVLLVWLQWSIIGVSTRLPIAYFLFYLTKMFMKMVCILPYPQNYIWHAPSFNGFTIPSLTVPYVGSADFFYSGHVGCCMLSFLEHYSYRCYWGCIFSLLTAILESVVMVATRGHYTIDLISGIAFAHWILILSRKIARYTDQWLALPPRLSVMANTKLEQPASLSERLCSTTELPTQL